MKEGRERLKKMLALLIAGSLLSGAAAYAALARPAAGEDADALTWTDRARIF
ncbi:hypothetical protein AB5I41_07110 [Sphingomonas sp. MMS24-JH45]